jgi:hypothetical protein
MPVSVDGLFKISRDITFRISYRSAFVTLKHPHLITIFNKDLIFSFNTSGYIVEDLETETRPSPQRNIN